MSLTAFFVIFFTSPIQVRSVIIFPDLHILSLKGWCNMKNEHQNSKETDNQSFHNAGNCHRDDTPKEVIPDEVPRKDGPGGE